MTTTYAYLHVSTDQQLVVYANAHALGRLRSGEDTAFGPLARKWALRCFWCFPCQRIVTHIARGEAGGVRSPHRRHTTLERSMSGCEHAGGLSGMTPSGGGVCGRE